MGMRFLMVNFLPSSVLASTEICRSATLSGKVRIKVPAGSSSGTEIRLKGQGFPSGQEAGDLYTQIQIRTPPELTAEQVELYELLRRLDEGKTEDT